MTLADVTRPDVLAAIAECDRLGREAFLETHGFGSAVGYFLVFDGRRYDSKAIVGYAHKVSQGTLLRAEDFSGGDRTVAPLLERLEFEVLRIRKYNWTRDEMVLACALIVENGWKRLYEDDPRAIELSAVLQTPAIHPTEGRGETFRSPASVAKKTVDIAAHHSSYKGVLTNGSHLDKLILAEFEADPQGMLAYAAAVRQALLDGDEVEHTPIADPDLDDASADEGQVLYRRHLRRERDPGIRRAKIAKVKANGQAISCEVCGFDFHRAYGDRGEDYIECHHRTPLAVSGPTKTRLDDLALICSNCHRMIHRKQADWLSIEQLTNIVGHQRTQIPT